MPAEMIERIGDFLPDRGLANLSQTSRQMRDATVFRRRQREEADIAQFAAGQQNMGAAVFARMRGSRLVPEDQATFERIRTRAEAIRQQRAEQAAPQPPDHDPFEGFEFP